MKLRVNDDASSKLKKEEYEISRGQVNSFYDSVLNRIKCFAYDIVPPNKVASCKEIMSELAKKASSEKKMILQSL
jgi:hypothetical protein